MRCGLAVIFLWFGATKFTSYEAAGVAQFVSNSPLVGWWNALLGIQGTSNRLGVCEISTGVLLLAGPEQARVVRAYLAQLETAHVYGRPIATRIDVAGPFYTAEAYHQDYLERRPTKPIHRHQRHA